MSERPSPSPELQTQQALEIGGELGKEIRWADFMSEALELPGSLGNTYNRFHNYSFNNQVLLYIQGVREPCASLKRWNAMNRRVKKGSKGKSILRPIFYKATTDEGEEVERLRGFKMVRGAFSVSQTEGEPLPEVELPEWSPDTALASLGIEEVPFEELNGNMAGYSYERKVAVSPVAPYPFKTLMHETAHVVHGHTTGEHTEHRGVHEFQAEATAYLVLNELEATEHMDASASRAYIQHWLEGQRPDDVAIRQVFTATDKILKAGRKEQS